MNGDAQTVSRVAVGFVLVGMLLSGPAGGIDFARERVSLGDGTASVTVLEPDDGPVSVTEGRFGTDVSYVRLPDLIVDATSVDGQPRVYYQVQIPELGIESQNYRIVRSTGRLRVPLSDRAVPKTTAVEGARARVVVRVQSFTGGYTVMNRTVPVRRR